MTSLYYLPARLTAWLRWRLAGPGSGDRGDSPVPSAIIIAGLCLLAFGVVAWIYWVGDGMMDRVSPGDLPEPPPRRGGE